MNLNLTFGVFIKQVRTRYEISSTELARKVGISTAYLTQIELGERIHPNPTLVLRVAKALNMNHDESELLFDLYSEATGQLPPDITEYLTGNQAALQALRQARDANVTAEDWERFIGQLKK